MFDPTAAMDNAFNQMEDWLSTVATLHPGSKTWNVGQNFTEHGGAVNSVEDTGEV